MNRTKLKWMRKLANTKRFVILTDDEAVINVPDINPNKFEDVQLVASQQAALESFKDSLARLISDYDRIVSKQLVVPKERKPAPKGKRIPVKKKINVKQG